MRKKIKFKNIIIIFLIVLVVILIITNIPNNKEKEINKMVDLTNKTISEVEEYSRNNDLELEINYEYNDNIEKDKVINQSIKIGSELKIRTSLLQQFQKGKLMRLYIKNIMLMN